MNKVDLAFKIHTWMCKYNIKGFIRHQLWMYLYKHGRVAPLCVIQPGETVTFTCKVEKDE